MAAEHTCTCERCTCPVPTNPNLPVCGACREDNHMVPGTRERQHPEGFDGPYRLPDPDDDWPPSREYA